MNREGPPLEALLRRIAEAPAPFLGEPLLGKSGKVHVAAVVGDLCRLLATSPPPAAALARFAAQGGKNDGKNARNALAVTLLGCWLLGDGWFLAAGLDRTAVIDLLDGGADELGRHTPARKFVTDPERREELARFVLARLGCRPAGETVAQAQDRLTSLSASERARVLEASRAAERRARAIREALARKAAEESADKWTRE